MCRHCGSRCRCLRSWYAMAGWRGRWRLIAWLLRELRCCARTGSTRGCEWFWVRRWTGLWCRMVDERGGVLDAAYVVGRLEEAGRTLLSLPNTGPSTRMRQGGLEWVRDVAESYGRGAVKLRPAIPSGAAIDRMDVALGWIGRIEGDRAVLRRVVGARSLVSPMTERHLYSWRRIGTAVGADYRAVQRWHGQGIAMIVAALNGRRDERGRI